MEKLGIKIPLLVFFLGVVYYDSKGSGIVDAVMRSFIFAFGVALILLLVTMMLLFFTTLESSRAEVSKLHMTKEPGKKVEVQA